MNVYIRSFHEHILLVYHVATFTMTVKVAEAVHSDAYWCCLYIKFNDCNKPMLATDSSF